MEPYVTSGVPFAGETLKLANRLVYGEVKDRLTLPTHPDSGFLEFAREIGWTWSKTSPAKKREAGILLDAAWSSNGSLSSLFTAKAGVSDTGHRGNKGSLGYYLALASNFGTELVILEALRTLRDDSARKADMHAKLIENGIKPDSVCFSDSLVSYETSQGVRRRVDINTIDSVAPRFESSKVEAAKILCFGFSPLI